MWRGGLGVAYLFPPLSSGGASIVVPCSVSTSRRYARDRREGPVLGLSCVSGFVRFVMRNNSPAGHYDWVRSIIVFPHNPHHNDKSQRRDVGHCNQLGA